jgi:hypothetical protein
MSPSAKDLNRNEPRPNTSTAPYAIPPLLQTRSLGFEAFGQMNGNGRNFDAGCCHPLMFDTLRAAEAK